ncbi:MAG: S-methyl-5'-thioadenosine phosphorylase [Dehalococcoidia bacterium]|jgi:5'-methylthioadenosine phosphorylase|nr:S-methyl-5'-thioadenosine phosphorylase [Dehalococcoidia bacterium]
MTDARAEVAVIGGSGFYEMAGLADVEVVEVETPYGAPSSPLTIGTQHGRRVAFLARHGEGHRILPEELPSRANIYALKSIGVERVLAVSAVGSLQQELEPLHAVIPEQLIDRTRGRPSTFFGDGLVAHVGFADPFCPDLASRLALAGDGAGVVTHRGGTLVVMNGPAFSTRAESALYRSWGASIIGMTALPEAKLAREAELCYGALCFVTDYDVWHDAEDDVSADLILQNLLQNVERGRTIVSAVVGTLIDERQCDCGEALAAALVTAPELVPPETRTRLDPLLRRHWGPAT